MQATSSTIQGGRPIRLLTILLIVPLAFLVSPVYQFVYYVFFPAYSATFYIKQIDAGVTLEYFYTEDSLRNSGRYLTVSTRSARRQANICGYDWPHRSRTSIYLTQDRHIAVLGPEECDYLITTEPPMIMKGTDAAASDRWTYLGAFDFGPSERGMDRRSLQFISAAQQQECIEITRRPTSSAAPRQGARKPHCPRLT